jgi:hypothetical protein
VLFVAIVVAHVLVVRFFPAAQMPQSDHPEQQIAFASLMAPDASRRQLSPARPPTPIHAARAGSVVPAERIVPDDQRPQSTPAPAVVDWAKQAEMVAADRVRSDAESSRQAAALSGWRANAMTGGQPPAKAAFAWDHSRIHRFEATPQGLIVNLNDRCALLITGLAILGGCKLGRLPVHGDLFAHMSETPNLSQAQDH